MKKTAFLSVSKATVSVHSLSVWECILFTKVNVTWNHCLRDTENHIAKMIMLKETMIKEQNFDDLALAF